MMQYQEMLINIKRECVLWEKVDMYCLLPLWQLQQQWSSPHISAWTAPVLYSPYRAPEPQASVFESPPQHSVLYSNTCTTFIHHQQQADNDSSAKTQSIKKQFSQRWYQKVSIANTNLEYGEEFYLRLFFFIHTKIIINNILVSINFDFAFLF